MIFDEFIKNDSSFYINLLQIGLPRMADYFLRVLYLTTELVMIVFVLFTVIFLNPKAVIILLIIMSPVLYITFRKLRNKFLILGNKNVKLEHESSKIIIDSIKFFKEIKIYGIQDKYHRVFTETKLNNMKVWIEKGIMESLPRYLFETYAIIFFLLYLIIVFTVNKLDIERIIIDSSVFAFAAVKLLPSINKIFNSINTMNFNQKSTQIILENFKNFPQKEFNQSHQSGRVENIQINNASFSYKNKKILNNFDLKVEKGDIIYMPGNSGKGKTTVLNLILGLLQFENGEYLINFNNKNLPLYKNFKIGFVAQQPLLISGSILDNIVLDINKINSNKLNKAIKISCISELINDVGINYNVGVDGNKLSGGQAQRICIARAIYNSDDLLIFDEATNSIDKSMKDQVFKNLLNYSKDKIVIFTSHDESLKKYANKIIKID